MSEIRVGENETLESALRRFKRKCARAGVLAEIRKREHYRKTQRKEKRKKSRSGKKKKALSFQCENKSSRPLAQCGGLLFGIEIRCGLLEKI